MTEPIHGGHLVPVHVDRHTHEITVLCHLDEEMWDALTPDGWALYCPPCGSVVTGIVPGTETLDLESAPAEVSDPYWQVEHRLSSEHAAECASPPDPDLADYLTLAAWGVQQ